MGFKCELSVVACVALYAAMQATSLSAQELLGPAASSGLQALPMPDAKFVQGASGLVRIQSTLIYYNSTDMDSVRQWTNKLDQFLKPYRNTDDPDSTVKRREICTYMSYSGNEKQACDVPVDDFHPCTSQNNYNYRRGAPCVFLKLDDTSNWSPKFVNTTEFISEDMPEDLKQHIRMVAGRPVSNTVWVSCQGENPADVENIGPVQYIPRRGFPSYYYPFTNKEGYLSPLVAVLFERPMRGVVIMVTCKAWTRDSVRYTHFELLID